MTKRRSPRAAAAQTTKAKYDAAGSGRRIRSWNPASSGPNRAVEGLQKIRDRARDSVRNDWAGASVAQKWATNLIGVGITPRWEDQRYAPLWADHAKVCDADGVLDAYGMQTLGMLTWYASGEVFLRRRPRDISLDLPAPVQYQMLEGDFVPLLDSDMWPNMPIGNTMRQGIERNKYGRRTAYWFYREHPGDNPSRPGTNDLVRVAASDVRHIFEPKRPGQMRGVSELASSLVRLRSSMDLEDTVLDRQKLANLFVAIRTQTMPDAADVDFDPDTGLPKWLNDDGTPMQALEPGIIQELRPGEDLKFSNPPEAGTTFSEYMRTTHLGTAAGNGLPYETMSGDIANVSDRTLRVIIQDFRRFARARQWQLTIPMLCQPMVDWWADALALEGTISIEEAKAAKACKWSPEGWEYLHPVQDATGKALEVLNGFRSRSSVVAERGDDVREVDAERAEDLKRDKKLGLHSGEPVPPAPVAKPAAPAPSPKAMEREALEVRRLTAEIQALERPAAAPAAADHSAIEHFIAGLSATNASVAQLAGSVAALAARPPSEIHNHIEPTPLHIEGAHVDVVNQVNPTPIAVAVDVAAPTVNVQAPTVSVVNDVKPATVDVTVSLPNRKTVSDIDRDIQGQITNITQIETTVK